MIATHQNCNDCVSAAHAGCGWCSEGKKCLHVLAKENSKDLLRAADDSCKAQSYTTCSACVKNGNVWCPATMQCIPSARNDCTTSRTQTCDENVTLGSLSQCNDFDTCTQALVNTCGIRRSCEACAAVPGCVLCTHQNYNTQVAQPQLMCVPSEHYSCQQLSYKYNIDAHVCEAWSSCDKLMVHANGSSCNECTASSQCNLCRTAELQSGQAKTFQCIPTAMSPPIAQCNQVVSADACAQTFKCSDRNISTCNFDGEGACGWCFNASFIETGGTCMSTQSSFCSTSLITSDAVVVEMFRENQRCVFTDRTLHKQRDCQSCLTVPECSWCQFASVCMLTEQMRESCVANHPNVYMSHDSAQSKFPGGTPLQKASLACEDFNTCNLQSGFKGLTIASVEKLSCLLCTSNPKCLLYSSRPWKEYGSMYNTSFGEFSFECAPSMGFSSHQSWFQATTEECCQDQLGHFFSPSSHEDTASQTVLEWVSICVVSLLLAFFWCECGVRFQVDQGLE